MHSFLHRKERVAEKLRYFLQRRAQQNQPRSIYRRQPWKICRYFRYALPGCEKCVCSRPFSRFMHSSFKSNANARKKQLRPYVRFAAGEEPAKAKVAFQQGESAPGLNGTAQPEMDATLCGNVRLRDNAQSLKRLCGLEIRCGLGGRSTPLFGFRWSLRCGTTVVARYFTFLSGAVRDHSPHWMLQKRIFRSSVIIVNLSINMTFKTHIKILSC